MKSAAAPGEGGIKRKTKKKPKRRRIQEDELLFYTGEAKYEVVLDCAREHGWTLVAKKEANKDRCNLYWVDICVVPDRLAKLLPWQCCNHFPGTGLIANKARMAKQLDKMYRKHPREYSFYPRTWVLPGEMDAFRQQFNDQGDAKGWFIIKPDGGCQGQGIFLTQNFGKVQKSNVGTCVAQNYIRKPLLIDGLKFDLRIYILVASVKPLELYAFKDGLVRLCTQEYVKPSQENQDDVCMHLTNYSLNKHSEDFVESEEADGGDEASKRSLLWLMQYLEEQYSAKKANVLWQKMLGVCLKTMISVVPSLQTDYDEKFGTTSDSEDWQLPSRCFEILGFDLMIDSQLRPWLVEVNHLPSFGTDSPFDFTLKQKLVHQAMNLCKALPSDKSEYDAEMLRRKESTPEAIRARLVEKITEVVTIVAPHRLPRLDALLLKHHGEEERLLGLLKTKHAKELAASEETVISPSIAIPSSPTLDATKVEAGLTSAASSLEDDPMVDADNSSLGDPGGSPISDSAAAVDTERAEDYEKIWPLPDVGPTGLPGKASLYRKLLDFALDQEDRRRKRFMAPLKKYAGTTPELPPVVAARRTTASCDSNNTTAAIWVNALLFTSYGVGVFTAS